MKAIFWFLLIVLAVLFGLFIYSATRQRLGRSNLVVFEVTAESVKAFEARVAELKKNAEILRDRLTTSRLIERILLNRRLELLEKEIADLQEAVAMLRSTMDYKSAADIYRKCLLLYGKASGVCELLATDTLPPADRQR